MMWRASSILSSPTRRIFRPTTLPALAPEVAQFEPKLALDGGADGLDCYRAILPQLPGLLADGGIAVFEIGQGQEEEVRKKLLPDSGLRVSTVKQ